MTYDLLIVGVLDLARLRAVLAALTGLPVGSVDVAAQAEMERNWKAAVLCTYQAVGGDLDLALDVYFAGAAPALDEFAQGLAEAFGVVVLWSAQEFPPSAFWLAAPDGPRTRARVYDLEVGPDDPMAMEIDAVERPVALLPGVRVAALPEVIREHRMATPVVEDLQSWLGGEALIPEPGGVLWKALDRLGAWEAFTARMNSGWPPDGWYPVEYLEEDLVIRDQLADDAAEVPGEVAGRFGAALERVDVAFRDGTRDDADAPGDAVWWRRRVVGLGQGPQGAEEGS